MWYNEGMSSQSLSWVRSLFQVARAKAVSRGSFGDDKNRLVEVYRAANEIEAALVVALLDSEGIFAITSGESLGSVYGMQFGPLAENGRRCIEQRRCQISVGDDNQTDHNFSGFFFVFLPRLVPQACVHRPIGRYRDE